MQGFGQLMRDFVESILNLVMGLLEVIFGSLTEAFNGISFD